MVRAWLRRLWWRTKPTPEPDVIEDLVQVVISGFMDPGASLDDAVKLLDGLDTMGSHDRDEAVGALAQGLANPKYPLDVSERLAFVLTSREFRDRLRREIAVRQLRPGRVV